LAQNTGSTLAGPAGNVLRARASFRLFFAGASGGSDGESMLARLSVPQGFLPAALLAPAYYRRGQIPIRLRRSSPLFAEGEARPSATH